MKDLPKLILGGCLVLAGCSDAARHETAARDDNFEIILEVLTEQIRSDEAIQRRSPGLPGIVLVGKAAPGGAPPIEDLDTDMISRLHSDFFKIRQASMGEIRGKGPGPNFLFDKELGERALRILVARPDRAGDQATVDTFNAMSSWDGIGGWFRTTLKRESGAWKVVKSERKGGTP